MSYLSESPLPTMKKKVPTIVKENFLSIERAVKVLSEREGPVNTRTRAIMTLIGKAGLRSPDKDIQLTAMRALENPAIKSSDFIAKAISRFKKKSAN